ncbi:transposon Tf2-6 polyprotein [Trichonephila clavipes]|nr:transposon Tf2-6 polyprotein [Trichonephila clavipes]
MNSLFKLAEKLKEFKDFKMTLKQKSSGPNVKKQESRDSQKRIADMNHQENSSITRKHKKFPASTNYNKHYGLPVTKYESVQKVKITALIDKNSTVSLLRENTSRRINGSNEIIEEQDASHSRRIYQIYLAIYPVKTLSAENALEKLKQQQKTFGNPIRIISDRGSAFTSKLFNDYCDEENIQHLQIATGVPRGNGQVERIHRTLIPVLTKLSLDDSTKWYKYVDRLQRILNSTISRSTKWTPFELLVGIKMRNKEDILIKDLLLEEMAKELLEQREFLRNDAKKNIETLQSENRKTYNRRRKKASLYKEGDLVAIQRTQFGAGLKLRPKFLGPYKVTKVNSKDRYEVEKVGQHDGPNSTTTSADLMKLFYA